MRRPSPSSIRSSSSSSSATATPSAIALVFPAPATPALDGAHEIVGVVEDTTYTSVYWKNHAMYFLPLTQRAGSANDPDDPRRQRPIHVRRRTGHPDRHPIPGFEKIVGDTLASINPNLTIVKFQTFQQQIDDRFIQERLIARLTSLFGLLALLLAAIGLYGVTAYTVVRRTPEIGIRMALGAARSRVIGTVMRGAMLQTVAGLAIGIPVAIFCVRYVKSQLYEITSVNLPVMAHRHWSAGACGCHCRHHSGAARGLHRPRTGLAH